MPSKKAKKRRKSGANRGLRWRRNHIGLWREKAGLTQQQVADRMEAEGLGLDRVSITRIEGGKQMPSIEALELIAEIVGAPSVTAMVDYSPAQWERIQQFLSMDEQEQERILRIAAAATTG